MVFVPGRSPIARLCAGVCLVVCACSCGCARRYLGRVWRICLGASPLLAVWLALPLSASARMPDNRSNCARCLRCDACVVCFRMQYTRTRAAVLTVGDRPHTENQTRPISPERPPINCVDCGFEPNNNDTHGSNCSHSSIRFHFLITMSVS